MSLVNPFSYVLVLLFFAVLVILLFKVPELYVAIFSTGLSFVHFAFSFFGGISRAQLARSMPLLLAVGGIAIFKVFHDAFNKRKIEPIFGRNEWKIILLALLMGILFILGLFHTPSPNYGRSKTILYFAINFGVLFFILTSINNQNRITLIIFLLALFAVIQVFITASNNFLSAGNIFGTYRGLSDYSSLRSGGEFLLGYRSASVLMLGYFSALGLISLLVLFWMSNSFIHRMIALPFLFLLATFIFVSGSRGPLVLVCVSSSAMALVAYPGQRRKSLLIITGILIFIVLTYLMLPKEITQRFQFAEVETSFSTRFNPSAWGLFVKGLDKPLWGWGTGSSPYLMFGGDSKMYPHNIFVELFCELGLIGLVIFCYFLYTAFKEFYFALRLSVPGSPLFYGLIWAFGLTIGMLIGAQLSGDINDASGVWLSVALMMKFSAMQEEQALISSDSTTSELAEVARIEDYNYFLSNR